MSKTRSAATILETAEQMDPREAADRLVRAQSDGNAWLDAFAEQLDRRRNADALKRILSIWNLNQSDAARAFGVSRQAISKWFESGVPADRAVVIADLNLEVIDQVPATWQFFRDRRPETYGQLTEL